MVGVLLVGIGLIFLRFDLTIRAPGIVNAVSEMRVFAPMDGAVSELTIQLGQQSMGSRLHESMGSQWGHGSRNSLAHFGDSQDELL